MLSPTSPTIDDAVRLLSAVGDTFTGLPPGLSVHAADVAARFSAHRGADAETVAAVYYAAALHGIGAIRVVIPRDASPRDAEIRQWDIPPAGAAIVTAMGIFPGATADAIRWHREAFDGTGHPDRLRWGGIPETAMTVSIARSFVTALEEQASRGGGAADAAFTLEDGSGSLFSLPLLRDFRAFLAAEPETFDAPYRPQRPLGPADPRELVALVCAHIDARHERTDGRGDRLERTVRALLGPSPPSGVDPDVAAFAGRLTALARVGRDGSTDDAFTLSRLGLEARAAQAGAAARLLLTAPTFAYYAPIVAAVEEWYDGTGAPHRRAGDAIDPHARVLAVAIAADAVVAADAARRIEAAAGTRLDPAFVAAYVAAGARR